MTLIADTGAIYACYDRSDAHHDSAKQFLSAYNSKPLVPALVLAELDHLVKVRLGEKARATVIQDVLDTMSVAAFNHEIARSAAEIASTYSDLGLGLTDATLIAHALEYRTIELLTVDQRHFRTVRPQWGGNSFQLLPFDA